MFIQCKQLPELWRVGKIDMCIWLVTFVSTVVLNVSLGLIVSVCFALITTVFRQQRPPTLLLGSNTLNPLKAPKHMLQDVCRARTSTAACSGTNKCSKSLACAFSDSTHP
jgi:MFS superfamily sulfate permease-like transporter